MDNDTKLEHFKNYQRLQRKRKRTQKEDEMLHSYRILEGGGFFDSIKKGIGKVVNKVKDITSFAPRQSFSPADKKVLDTYGMKQIQEIKVVRTPLSKWIDKIINWASFGKFQKEASARGYDDLFHLYMLIFVDGAPQPILYEKNSTPRITFDIPTDKYINANTQMIMVPLPSGSQLTLSQLVSNAQTDMGADYWKYSMSKLNCQDFISRTLKASNLLTPQAQSWIVQNVLDIGKTIHPIVRAGFQKLTDLDAYGRKVLGRGFDWTNLPPIVHLALRNPEITRGIGKALGDVAKTVGDSLTDGIGATFMDILA